ncbi:hypothetical protein HYE31_00985 [Mycoplasmopsis bovis]|nr:hypothetical protein HYE31_00985 [Mycoplasmopsis bovis]
MHKDVEWIESMGWKEEAIENIDKEFENWSSSQELENYLSSYDKEDFINEFELEEKLEKKKKRKPKKNKKKKKRKNKKSKKNKKNTLSIWLIVKDELDKLAYVELIKKTTENMTNLQN